MLNRGKKNGENKNTLDMLKLKYVRFGVLVFIISIFITILGYWLNLWKVSGSFIGILISIILSSMICSIEVALNLKNK